MTQVQKVEVRCPRCSTSRCYWRQREERYVCMGCGHVGGREQFEHAVEATEPEPEQEG